MENCAGGEKQLQVMRVIETLRLAVESPAIDDDALAPNSARTRDPPRTGRSGFASCRKKARFTHGTPRFRRGGAHTPPHVAATFAPRALKPAEVGGAPDHSRSRRTRGHHRRTGPFRSQCLLPPFHTRMPPAAKPPISR